MLKRKNLIALFLAALMAVTLISGCSGAANPAASSAAPAAPSAPATQPSAAPSEAPAASGDSLGEIDETTVVVGVHVQIKTLDYAAMEYFCKLLEERSGGKIKTELYGEGTLGDEAGILEQVQVNTVQIATTGFSGLDKYISSVNCWSVPYLFTSVDQVKASFDGKLGDAARALFEENGIYYMGNTYRGNRQLTASRAIATPKDLSGLKLRLPDTSAWIKVWESMGCLASPIASAEVFSALQTGVVDAQENPISSIYAKDLWEVQDYVVMTNHIVDFLAVTMSKKFYDGLSPATQALIDECMADALDYMEKSVAESESKMVEEMKGHGMEFIEVDTSAFAEAAQGGIAEVAKGWEDWVFDAALEIVKA